MDNRRLATLIIVDEIISSSSSSDSDLDFNDTIFNNNNHRCIHKIPRIQNFIENVIARYDDQQFQEHFRLRRSTFNYVLYLIRADLESKCGNTTVDAEKQLYVALYILGTPDSYRSVTIKFDIGKATAWRAVKRVVRAICKLRTYFIRWPTARECIESSRRIEERHGFPGVIGAVDGTHIQIAAPRVDPQSYINRKSVHSIQLQVVCNDKLEFIHCYAGLPGSVHDMRVFRYSGLQQRCNEQYFPHNTHLMGDSAYTLQKHIMVPYQDNGHLTVEQTYFNTTLSSTRMMVERSIGLLKGRWRFFLNKLPMKRTDLIPYYIVCICVLHNICLKKDDTFEYPIIIPSTIDANVGPMEAPNNLKQEGNEKRQRITEDIWNKLIL